MAIQDSIWIILEKKYTYIKKKILNIIIVELFLYKKILLLEFKN